MLVALSYRLLKVSSLQFKGNLPFNIFEEIILFLPVNEFKIFFWMSYKIYLFIFLYELAYRYEMFNY